MIWKPFLLGLTWQACPQSTIWSSPHNNYQLSLLIFQEMNNSVSHYKAHQQSVPFSLPSALLHPYPYSCSASHLLLCELPFWVRRIPAWRPSGDVFENSCNLLVLFNTEKSENGSMSSSDTSRIQRFLEMLVKRDIWRLSSPKPCLQQDCC